MGWVGERLEPWFYESRFLRPRALRQAALAALRRLSAAPVLPSQAGSVGRPARHVTTDVLVVGGGPCGIAAASGIAARGVPVLVVTGGPAGGSLPRSASMAHRVQGGLRSLEAAGARILERTWCLGRYEQEGIFAAVGAEGAFTIEASRVVVATGAYDRPLVVPGADLPGVIGLRGFEALASQGVFDRAGRIGVYGRSAELRRATDTAKAFGIELAWACGPGTGAAEAAGRPPRSLIALEGRRRVRAAVLDGGERRRVDVLVFGFTQPTYELQLQNGRSARLEGSPPVVATDGVSRLPMLVVGEAAGWVDPGGAWEAAGTAASEWEEGDLDAGPPLADSRPLAAPSFAPDAVVCVCEDVRVRDLDACLADGFGEIELVKRRSGAATGACQGKLCLGALAEVFAARGMPTGLPTIRPPIRPMPIAGLGSGKR